MAERVVGLSIADESLRGVELRSTRRSRRHDDDLAGVGAIELPPGIVDQGEVVDLAAFTEQVRRLWAVAGFSSKRVAVGLDARAAVVRRAELPRLDDRELKQAAAFEIGELLSYPLREALVSAQPVGNGRDPDVETVEVLILAIKQRTIVDIHSALADAGLRAVDTQLTQSALVATFGSPNPLPADGVGVMVAISRAATNVMIHDNSGLLLSRVVTAGVGGASTLSDELQVELDMLNGFGSDRPAGGSDAAAASGVSTVLEGVRRTLHYYGSEIDSRPLQRIVLCGEQSHAGGLAQGLADSFPEADVLRHESSHRPGAEMTAADFDEAVAIARAFVGPGPDRRFDFVPTIYREQRATRLRAGVGVAAALTIAPLLVADAMDRGSVADEQETIAEGVERRVDDLRLQLESFDDQLERESIARRGRARIETLEESAYPMSLVMRQVAEAMPADTFLLAARLQRTAAGETPTGYAGSTPPAVMTITGVAADLDGVGRWMEAVATVPLIDAVWLAQSAIGPYDATDRLGAVFTVDAVLVDPSLAALDEEAGR